MKVEKLIFGAILIVWGIFAFIRVWSFGFLGPMAAIISFIPMIISGAFLIILGLIQGESDEKETKEKNFLIVFIFTSIISLLGLFFGLASYYGTIGIFLVVGGIVLAPSSKRRFLQIVLCVIIVIVMIINLFLAIVVFGPPP